MGAAFRYAGSLTGASIDECEVSAIPIFESILTKTSEAHHLVPPVLPTRRSLEAYTRCQTLPKEPLYNSVHQHARSLAAMSLTRT